MPVFNIPAEYYGLVGIGNAIGEIGAGQRERRDRRRKEEREDFVFDEAKKDAERGRERDIIQRYGQGSKAHAAYLTSIGKDPSGILKPLEVRNAEELERILTIPEENRTREEKAKANLLQGLPVEGLEAQLDSIARRVNMENLNLVVASYQAKEAQYSFEKKQEIEESIRKKFGISSADLEVVQMDISLKQARASLGLTQANINATNASAARDRAYAVNIVAEKTDPNKRLQALRDRFDSRFNKINDQITGIIKARSAEEGQNKPSQAAIDSYTRQINQLRQEQRRLNEDYTRDASAITGTSSEGATAPISSEAGSNPLEGIPADAVEELKATALDFGSAAAIDASGLPDSQKTILKSLLVAANVPKNDVNFPSKEAPVTTASVEVPAPARQKHPKVARGRVIDTNREKIKTEQRRLEKEISKLERDIKAVRNNPMSSTDDRRRLAQWESSLAVKQTRLNTVNGLLKGE
jgi:hypothetical protein